MNWVKVNQSNKGGNKISTPLIYVISDSIGETAEFVAKAAISQFNSGQADLIRVPYVQDEEHLAQVLEEAAQKKAIVAYTLVIPQLREQMTKLAKKKKLIAVDVLGPMMEAIEKVSSKVPHYEPGLLHKLDAEYFHRVEAIEFAVKYDDGKDPRGILYANLVLVGISRTSKTPLCMYLANKRIKAANIPLVPEVAPPEELMQAKDSKKIIGLTVRPDVLNPIRQERLKALGLAPNAEYASYKRILEEIEYAEGIMKKLGCPIIDVSSKAIEETASRILQIYYRGEQSGKN